MVLRLRWEVAGHVPEEGKAGRKEELDCHVG